MLTAAVVLSLLGSAVAVLPHLAAADAATGHRIRVGETLGGLHRRYHRSVRCLARRNHLANRNVIYAGRRLVIPSRAWCRGRRHTASRTPALSRSTERRALPGVQSVAAYKAWARRQVGGVQFAALDAIWTRESGWNPRAQNPSSGAYGIPQALPGAKMADAGSDWSWNAYTQMRWGIDYINARYGSCAHAWAFWQAHHWY